MRAAVLCLNQGEDLFRAGDPKTHLYRVENGCLCIYEPNSAEHRLGLGYLENHTYSARAIGETRVTCLPFSAVDRIPEAGPPARDQLQQAIDNELEFGRDGLVRAGQRNPIGPAESPGSLLNSRPLLPHPLTHVDAVLRRSFRCPFPLLLSLQRQARIKARIGRCGVFELGHDLAKPVLAYPRTIGQRVQLAHRLRR